MLFQLTFPFRHLLYEGNMFWHEQGYRFGWRVMLMEKAGYAQFKIEDKDGRTMEVRNADFLTPVQEKMMSTQPDLMIQYAHFLKAYYQSDRNKRGRGFRFGLCDYEWTKQSFVHRFEGQPSRAN